MATKSDDETRLTKTPTRGEITPHIINHGQQKNCLAADGVRDIANNVEVLLKLVDIKN